MASSATRLELVAPSHPLDHKQALQEIRNYLAGRFVGATRDETLLKEVQKCLFTQLHLERDGTGSEVRHDANEGAIAYRMAFRTVRSKYPRLFGAEEELLLDPAALDFVMRALARIPLRDAKRDALGDAFELFVGDHIRGQSGQFFTPKNAVQLLVDAVSPTLRDTVIDPACGAGGFLSATIQRLLAEGASAGQITDFASTRLFGVDKDAQLAALAQAHIAFLADGRPRIECADSLAWHCQIPHALDDFPVAGEYDVVLTNPPFGSKIVAASGDVLAQYQLARKWSRGRGQKRSSPSTQFQSNVSPQVLFVERCIQLLKPGGRLGIVLPESLISSQRHRYVVEYMRTECQIEAVLGMPENLFKTSGKGGTHTKTCLVVLSKRVPKSNTQPGRIMMAEAKWCGHDSRGKAIPHDDLPLIAARLHTVARSSDSSHLGFVISEEDLRDEILAPRHYDPSVTAAVAQMGDTHEAIRFGDLVDSGVISLSTGDEVGKLAYGTGTIPFIRTSDLSNWELKTDAKHGLSDEVFARLGRKQDVQPGDIFMVRDGTYLIGTCAMVTPADLPLVYQSHIYKIRVEANDIGLSSHLLLALLSSSAVQTQIKSKRVTQDIIDSLGNRIMDLILPFPKSAKQRDDISAKVASATELRNKARALLREVKSLVSAG